MARRVVLISFTPLDAGGGVPRWNRDVASAFPDREVVHFSWWDHPVRQTNVAGIYEALPEWQKAEMLGQYLTRERLVTPDDVIIGDGFWASIEDSRFKHVISVAHGIWSHLTKEDVEAGRAPEFPHHHAAQVSFRRSHLRRGRPIVAVSEFIQREMRRQWDFPSTVINNAVDTERFLGLQPEQLDLARLGHRLFIHGVTTENKGFDHIRAVAESGVIDDADELMLLDDAAAKYAEYGDKYHILAMASGVIQPSAYEGNSYFVLETMASDVPIVAYPVGLLHSVRGRRDAFQAGVIISEPRSPHATVDGVRQLIEELDADEFRSPRLIALDYDISLFREQWRNYVEALG